MTLVSWSCLQLYTHTPCVLRCTSLLVFVTLMTGVHALCHSVIHPFSLQPHPRSQAEATVSGNICHRVSKAQMLRVAETHSKFNQSESFSVRSGKQRLHNYQQLQSKLTSTVTDVFFVFYRTF